MMKVGVGGGKKKKGLYLALVELAIVCYGGGRHCG